MIFEEVVIKKDTRMNKIETNHKKNRLVIRLNGFRCANKALLISEIEEAANTLSLGFSCITILSEDTIISGKDLQALEDLLYAYGLRSIVYVGGELCSSFQLKASSNARDLTINQVNTREEAEAVLSAPPVLSVERSDTDIGSMVRASHP